jgi:8-oxo-dGTP diphosphatase
MKNKPKVGIEVIIIKNGKILLGERINLEGENTWGFPGGHLEFGESWEECAIRETMEETGIKITNIRFGTVINGIYKEEGKHYVSIFMLADYDSGDVQVMEPEKCEGWDWFEWNDLPSPLFGPIKILLEKRKEFDPSDL